MAQTNNRTVVLGSLVSIGILWIMTITNIFDMLGESAAAPVMKRDSALPTPHAFKNVDTALVQRPSRMPYEFEGRHQNPFRALAARSAQTTRPRAAKSAPQCHVLLKGILEKEENPLAIIQDETGMTRICKKGDTVCEMTVAQITKTGIELKGNAVSLFLQLPQR